jgi:hypothetical protein
MLCFGVDLVLWVQFEGLREMPVQPALNRRAQGRAVNKEGAEQ